MNKQGITLKILNTDCTCHCKAFVGNKTRTQNIYACYLQDWSFSWIRNELFFFRLLTLAVGHYTCFSWPCAFFRMSGMIWFVKPLYKLFCVMWVLRKCGGLYFVHKIGLHHQGSYRKIFSKFTNAKTWHDAEKQHEGMLLFCTSNKGA